MVGDEFQQDLDANYGEEEEGEEAGDYVYIVPTLRRGNANPRTLASITGATPLPCRVPSHVARWDAGASLAAFPRWSMGTIKMTSALVRQRSIICTVPTLRRAAQGG
jgi:hypothetical protein